METSIWEMQNYPVQGDKATFRLSDVGTIQYEDTFDKITKTNQEYDVSVQYDFIGDYMLSNKVKERVDEGNEPEYADRFPGEGRPGLLGRILEDEQWVRSAYSVYLTGIRYNLFYLCHLARILEASDDRNADRAFVVYRLFFGFLLFRAGI